MRTIPPIALVPLGLFAALLGGCGGPTPTSGRASQAFLAVSNGPRQATWTRNFNPLHPGALFPSAGGIYEPLLIFNRAKATYVPWLASSYSWSTDNTRLTFDVRPGVKWSDGKPFTDGPIRRGWCSSATRSSSPSKSSRPCPTPRHS